MRASNTTLTQLIDSLAPYCDVANESCGSMEECQQQLSNRTCLTNLESARLEQSQVQLRWWYSLKRERAFLVRLLAACEVQGGATCMRVVNGHLATHDADIALQQPPIDSTLLNRMLKNSVAVEQAQRRCDEKPPCVSKLLAPVWAVKEETSIRDAIREALWALEPDPSDSAAFFGELTQLASKPFQRCGFYHGLGDIYPVRCPVEDAQSRNLWNFMIQKKGRDFLTKSQAVQFEVMFRACWLDCALFGLAELFSISAVRRRKDSGVNLVRYIRILCDSQSCLRAATDAVWTAGLPSGVLVLQKNPASKLYAVISISLNCLLITVGFAVAVLAGFVWKVAPMMITYLVILALSVVAMILNMVFSIAALTGSSDRVFSVAESVVCPFINTRVLCSS